MKTLPLRLALLGASASALLSGAAAQTLCSQNTDNTTILPMNGIACSAAGIAAPNQFLRRFSAATDCSAPNGQIVQSVTWGAESAVAGLGAGSQPISIRVYSIPTGAPFLFSNLTLLSAVEDIPYADNSGLVTTMLTTPACVFPGQDTVLEVSKLTVVADGHSFFPATNDLGQSGDSFIAAVTCGLTEPTPLSAIGFPDVHVILTMEQTPLVGSKFCGPAVANSTMLSAEITAVGSDVAMDNDLTLQVKNLPSNSSGIFFLSPDQVTVPNPAGSFGDICIASFTLGRYASFIQNTGMGSTVSLALDLTNTPLEPSGPFAIVSGQTWNFQYWYRDNVSGTAGSNFSDGLSVAFQ